MNKEKVVMLSTAMELLALAKRLAADAGASLAEEAILDAESRTWEARESARKDAPKP